MREQVEDLGPGTVHTYRQKALSEAREIVEGAFAAVTEFEETKDAGIDPDVAKAMMELEVDATLTLLGYRGRPVSANQAVVGCHNSSVDFDTARLREERDEWRNEAKRLLVRVEEHDLHVEALEADLRVARIDRDEARQLAENHRQAREVAERELREIKEALDEAGQTPGG
jgi:hypothetical protein